MLGALILAGGKSQRIRENKALIKLVNKPLLLHVVEKAVEITDEIVVAIGKNDEPKKYARFLPSTVKIVNDAIKGKGPLAGILAGMQEMLSEYTVVLPCDAPFVKKEVIKYLFGKAGKADAVIPQWPNGYVEPLHAVYRILPSISATKEALSKEELQIVDMIKRLKRVIYVSTDEIRKIDPDLISFFNINNQENLKLARTLKLQLG
jgi:molybdopterin-guanine dinucleotide biosynthesis protein A